MNSGEYADYLWAIRPGDEVDINDLISSLIGEPIHRGNLIEFKAMIEARYPGCYEEWDLEYDDWIDTVHDVKIVIEAPDTYTVYLAEARYTRVFKVKDSIFVGWQDLIKAA